MTTFTVLNRHGEVQTQNASLSEAAQTVLGYDGHEYEIRRGENNKGFWLYVSQFSRNSSCGGRPLVRSCCYPAADTEAEAETEIFQHVINHASFWDGQTVMTDEAYAREQTEISEAEREAAEHKEAIMWKSIFPAEAAALSPETLAECINTLRYLDAEFRQYGTIDLVNMRHVTAALARVEAETARAAAPIKQAAE